MLRRILLIVLVLGASLAAPAQNWTEVRTGHFSVVVPQGTAPAIYDAQNLEQLRDLMGTLLARRDLHVPAPGYVVIVRTPAELQRLVGNAPAGEIAAIGPEAAFFFYDGSSQAAVSEFQYDFGRYLLEANYPRTPPWFDEGLAGYFSTVRLQNQMDALLGAAPEGFSETLRQAGWIPLEKVLAAEAGSPLRQDQHFRAEAWALVHYVFANQKVGETGQYFALTQNQGATVAEAVQQAFGMSVAQLDQAVHAAALVYPVKPDKQSLASPVSEDNLGIFEEKAADLAALVADYRLHSGGDPQIEALQQQLQQGNNIAVLRTLGAAFLAKKDYERATDYLRRAANLDPKDGLVEYYLGRLEYEAAQVGGEAAALDARTPLQMAVKAYPEFANAHYLLGLTLMGSQDEVDGLRALQTAVHLAPRDDRYALALADGYLQARDFDRAEALLGRLANSPDPKTSAEASKKRDGIAALKKAPATAQVDVDVYRYNEKQWGETGSGKIPSLDELDTAEKKREAEEAAAKPDHRPVQYAVGTAMGVDCSKAPAATLTLLLNTKPVTFYTANVAKVPIIGAASLSCTLKDRRVAVNYRAGSEHAENDLVSVELK